MAYATPRVPMAPPPLGSPNTPANGGRDRNGLPILGYAKPRPNLLVNAPLYSSRLLSGMYAAANAAGARARKAAVGTR